MLAPEVIDRIAAGEVIERPAAVLKELVENSLDADASRIEVELAGAGSELIQVRDDGCGMTPDEMHLALERHATSKIRSFEDLTQVQTLGFRGEALPSIAAVARLEMTSAAPSAVSGHRLVVEGGHVLGEETVPFPQGTLVRVRDLYFNTPARRKFIRSGQAEWRQLLDTASRLALSAPDVSFRVVRQGKVVFLTPGRGDLDAALLQVWGRQLTDQMVPVDFSTPGIRVYGRVGRPTVYRTNRQQELIFLNGRFVREQLLHRAVEEAFRRVLASGRFPVAAIFVELSTEELDPNVHPTKLQVRLQRPESLMAALRQAVEEALVRAHGRGALLSGSAGAGNADMESLKKAGDQARETEASYWGQTPALFSRPGHTGQNTEDTTPGDPPYPAAPGFALRDPEDPARSLGDLKVLGQVYEAYLVAQGSGGLFVVEQHAAHERVLFERLQGQVESTVQQAMESQTLLIPVHLELTPGEATALEAQEEELEGLGFDITPLGDNDVMLRAVPRVISQGNEENAFRETLQVLQENKTTHSQPWQERLALVLACHGAIRSGQYLAPAEAQALVDQLGRCRQPATCPHGRPTLLHLSQTELDQRLKRGQ